MSSTEVGSSPELLISELDLQERVKALGAEISAEYPDGVVLVAVLKASVVFLADLVRSINVHCEVDFLAISAYATGTGRVRIQKDLDSDICDKDVVLVEDIADTGLTLTYLLGELARRQPRSLAVCALLDKSVRRIVPVELRFVGFEIDDDFAIGYGLDYQQIYRNLPALYRGELNQLTARRDTYVKELYRK